MHCPFCGTKRTQTIDSRPVEDSAATRRRRLCRNPECNSRFTTYERVQLRDIKVVKRSGAWEPFDRDKVLQSMKVALRKRPVSNDRVDGMVNNMQRHLEDTLPEAEIPSSEIGEMVMQRLSELDQIAYVRFASVYRDFAEKDDFRKFLEALS